MPVAATQITEFIEIDADRVDLVKTPANGFPFLMIKALDDDAVKAVARGKRDETPDIENAETVLGLLGKLVASEASELAAGYTEEICDIKLLLEAIGLMKWFKENEECAAAVDAAAMKSADPAAIVAAAKRLKESFEEPTVADPATKAEETPEAPTADSSIVGDLTPETPEVPVVDEAAKALATQIEDAVAKAISPLEEANAKLRDDLAKVLATPIPGGPAITAPPSARAESARSDLLAKAARFERMADQISEPDMKTHYRAEAAAAKAAANA